jgi:hypothetical protein
MGGALRRCTGARHRQSTDLRARTAGRGERSADLEQGACRRPLRDQQSPTRHLPLNLVLSHHSGAYGRQSTNLRLKHGHDGQGRSRTTRTRAKSNWARANTPPVPWHEVTNTGDTTMQFQIVEKRPTRHKNLHSELGPAGSHFCSQTRRALVIAGHPWPPMSLVRICNQIAVASELAFRERSGACRRRLWSLGHATAWCSG